MHAWLYRISIPAPSPITEQLNATSTTEELTITVQPTTTEQLAITAQPTIAIQPTTTTTVELTTTTTTEESSILLSMNLIVGIAGGGGAALVILIVLVAAMALIGCKRTPSKNSQPCGLETNNVIVTGSKQTRDELRNNTTITDKTETPTYDTARQTEDALYDSVEQTNLHANAAGDHNLALSSNAAYGITRAMEEEEGEYVYADIAATSQGPEVYHNEAYGVIHAQEEEEEDPYVIEHL